MIDPAAFVTLVQLAGVIGPLVIVLAGAAFAIWCLVGLALWLAARRHPAPRQGATDPEWFDSLPAAKLGD